MNTHISKQSKNAVIQFLTTHAPQLNQVSCFPYFSSWMEQKTTKSKYGSNPNRIQYKAESKAIASYAYALAMFDTLQTPLAYNENPEYFFDCAIHAPQVLDDFDFPSLKEWNEKTDIFEKYDIQNYPQVEKPTDENFKKAIYTMNDAEQYFLSILCGLNLTLDTPYNPNLNIDDLKKKYVDDKSQQNLLDFCLEIYQGFGEKGFAYMVNEEKYVFESDMLRYITECLYEAEKQSAWACYYAQSMSVLEKQFNKPF